MKLSILHASRQRPDQALQAIVHWLSNIEYPQSWEYILSVDSSDPELSAYQDLGLRPEHNQFIVVNDNHNLVEAANQAARVATGDILILISDDFLCTKGWNKMIVDAMAGKSGVLKTFDGIQRWIVTLPVMTRDYYDEQCHFYFPHYDHMFCDTDMTHLADVQKKLIIRNDIVFRHNHYSIGGNKKDEVNVKADGTWRNGEETYITRCRNKFGLQGVNIYDLSPEATKAGHVNWLKKKLR